MQNIHGNTYQCAVGETVTMTFQPSAPNILKVLYKKNIGDNLKDVGNSFTLDIIIGNQQVNIDVLYVFFPGAAGNCRIFLEGDQGGQFENTPPATDHPGLPEDRTYRFIPLIPQ